MFNLAAALQGDFHGSGFAGGETGSPKATLQQRTPGSSALAAALSGEPAPPAGRTATGGRPGTGNTDKRGR